MSNKKSFKKNVKKLYILAISNFSKDLVQFILFLSFFSKDLLKLFILNQILQNLTIQ